MNVVPQMFFQLSLKLFNAEYSDLQRAISLHIADPSLRHDISRILNTKLKVYIYEIL